MRWLVAPAHLSLVSTHRSERDRRIGTLGVRCRRFVRRHCSHVTRSPRDVISAFRARNITGLVGTLRALVMPAALAGLFFGYTGVSISGTTARTHASRFPEIVMRTTKSPVLGVLLGLSFIAACRGGSGNGANPDAPTGPGSDAGDGRIHIQDVQRDTMAPGTAVELHGVIVTAVDKFGSRTSAFWVEEPGGGPSSGVQVFVNAQVALLQDLVPGDIVDITGAVKTEFALSSDTTGRTTTELQASSGGMLKVTKTGTGAVPAPHVIDAAMLDGMSMADRDVEYEKWEGVLVEVRNVRSRSYPVSFASGSPPFADDTYKVNITDNLVLESTQAKFTGIDGLTCFVSITGVEDYFFDWLLLPRSAADLVIGTSCAPVTITTSTISAVQSAFPTGVIELNNIYVTGTSFGKTSFWASTSPTAAANEGAYVFQSSKAVVLDPAIVTGVQVNVIGTVSEFNDDTSGGTLTEVQPLRITVVNGTPTALTPISGLTAASLLDQAAAPQYESVLVTLDNVAITAIGISMNGFVATGMQAGTTFGLGTDILRLATGDVGCYASITGFWTNLEVAGAMTKPNAYGFIPLTLTGKGTGTCN